MDVKKMKVAELRQELQERGLDTRGLKAELAGRLQEALDAELLSEEGGGGGGEEPRPSRVYAERGGDDEDDDDDEEEEEEEEEDELLAGGEEEEEEEEEAAAAPPTAEAPASSEDPCPLPEAEGRPGGAGEPGDEARPSWAERVEAAELQQQEEVGRMEQEAQEEPRAQAGTGQEQNGEEAPQPQERAEPAGKPDSEREPGEGGSEARASVSETRPPPNERRGQKRRHEERGRGYYEFREETYYNRARSPVPVGEEEETEEEFDDSLVCLDTYNSDIHFQVAKDRYGGQPLSPEKFAYLWGGARATYGVLKGKVCFEVKVTQKISVKQLAESESERHIVRVGWSLDSSSLQLGDGEFSYGYDGAGRKWENAKFEEYGEKFDENDVIGCFANFDSEEVELSFSKNGENLGVAFTVSKESLGERALFPHILSKNCAVECNFGHKEEPFFPIPEDYVLIQTVPLEGRVRGAVGPKTKNACEVILMVGMPGVGKTTWVKKHVAENPEKRYTVLGTHNILDKMRVKGLEGPEVNAERRNTLTQQATQCLSKLIQIAACKKRNYILDQTNVYSSAQRRKMMPFKGFNRQAMVICPSDEDWKTRMKLRTVEEGEDVPEFALNEMKVNFTLPEASDFLDQVTYVELEKEQASKLVSKYREEAKKARPQQEKRQDRRNYRNRNDRDRNYGGYRMGRWDNRNYDRPQYGQGWGPAYGNNPAYREDYHKSYDRYRQQYDRSYSQPYDYPRYRDYYREYAREWHRYYEERNRYYNNYYGYR